VGPTGSVSGILRLTAIDAVGLNPIVCTQTSHTTALFTATVTFTVTTAPSTCRVGTPSPTCVVDQAVGTTVTGTALTMSTIQNTTPNASGGLNPTNLNVEFSQVTLGQPTLTPECGTPNPPWPCGTTGAVFSNGHLNTVVVDDNRGDLAGWTLTGLMTTTFQGPSDGLRRTIPASDLAWLPSVSSATTSCVTLASVKTCGQSDVVTEISPGPIQRLSTSESAVLCQAAPGGGGGGTRCGAEMYLDIPGNIIAGQYTATLEIVLS
jgi:hypothetical protein